MSCDRDRRKWWGYFGRYYRNHLSKGVREALKSGFKNYVQSKVEEALKGGSGSKYSGRGSRQGTWAGSRSGKSRKSTGKPKTTKSSPPQSPTLGSVSVAKAAPADLPEIIFKQVKQAAEVRENDWTPDERDELAWKTRMLRRMLRTDGEAPLDIDPAHGDSDLPKISSQAGLAAVYDWLKESKVGSSSPLDPAYKAIWREKNDYTEREKIELHRLVEEIDVQYQRGYIKKNPRTTLVRKIKESTDPKSVRALMADEVQFTAFHSARVKAKIWHEMLVYVHLASATAAVHRDASKFKDEMPVPVEVRAEDAAHLTKGTPITVIPFCKGVQFNPESFTFRWLEDYHRTSFRVYCDAVTGSRGKRGSIEFLANGCLIGRLPFNMRFEKTQPRLSSADWEQQVNGRMLLDSQVFISYSHEDTEIVELMRRFIQGLGYRTLMDIHELRGGLKWDEKLMSMIEDADIFQLFWSENSAESKYVRKEWKHALKCKKVMVPVYWQKPLSPPPPRELKSIQFGYLPVTELKS